MICLHFPHFYVGRLALYNYLHLLDSHVHALSPVLLLVTAVRSVIDLIDAPGSRHGGNVNPRRRPIRSIRLAAASIYHATTP